MKISGIYKIINKTNGKYYVGSSNDIKRRWSQHKSELKLKSRMHDNSHLRNAWNKDGENNFDFVVVEIIENPTKETLLLSEQKYLNEAKQNQDQCYNLQFIASGGEWSDESKKKLSDYRKGRKLSYLHRKHIGDAIRGRKFSKEHCEKIGKKLTGINNPSYEDTIYCFQHKKTNEIFSGTKLQFRKKLGLLYRRSLSGLINGKEKSVCGWGLLVV